jgi:hypothetical protein
VSVDLILLGLAIALEPLPLSAYLLLLSSTSGPRKGFGFLVGWVVTLAGVVALTLAVTGGHPVRPSTVPSTTSLIVKVALGTVLLGFAWRQQARRGRPKSPPKWMARIDRLNVLTAAGLAFLLQPWGLTAAGAATAIEANLSRAASVAGLVVFFVLSTASYAAMQVYVLRSPVAAGARLAGLNSWIIRNTDHVIVIVSAAIGAWLVGHSAYQLAS